MSFNVSGKKSASALVARKTTLTLGDCICFPFSYGCPKVTAKLNAHVWLMCLPYACSLLSSQSWFVLSVLTMMTFHVANLTILEWDMKLFQ